jgi:hypothetical protein
VAVTHERGQIVLASRDREAEKRGSRRRVPFLPKVLSQPNADLLEEVAARDTIAQSPPPEVT